jgi:hypothetical protein
MRYPLINNIAKMFSYLKQQYQCLKQREQHQDFKAKHPHFSQLKLAQNMKAKDMQTNMKMDYLNSIVRLAK